VKWQISKANLTHNHAISVTWDRGLLRFNETIQKLKDIFLKSGLKNRNYTKVLKYELNRVACHV